MSYARLAALAGAVLWGSVLSVTAQESSSGSQTDDALRAKSAPPSDASNSTRAPEQRPGRAGYRTGNDAPEMSKTETGDEGSEKPQATSDDSQFAREPIDPAARVIQFSFAKEPWEHVLEWIAKLSGLSLQMDVVPQGTFNYINDPREYTLGEAMDVINAQLVPKGFTLARKGNYLKVIPLAEGIPPDIIPRIKPQDLDVRGESEFVSVILPVETMSASAAAKEIEGLKGQYGKVIPLDSANRVMITDTVANTRLMRDLLDQIDGEGASLKAKHRVFTLQYASASKVEATLRDLLGLPPRTTATSTSSQRGDPRDEFRERMERMRREMERGGGMPFGMMFGGMGGSGDQRGGDERGSRGSDSRGSAPSQPTTPTVTLAVDELRNQIFVMAPPDKLAIVEEAIRQMDVPRPGADPFKPREPQTPTVKTYRLSDGDAQSLATALNSIYQNTPGVRISADQSNNMIVVVATPDDQEQIATLVEQFEYDERSSIVLPLTVLDATAVETLLQAVYASGQRDWRGNSVPRPGQPRVVADRSRNQLMVRGSKKQVDDIRSMLVSLGEPSLSPVAGNDVLRRIPMGAADQQILIEAVQKFWPSVRPNNNRIEIIDLNRRSSDEPRSTRDPLEAEPTDNPQRRFLPRESSDESNEQSPRVPTRTRAPSNTPDRTSRDRRSTVTLVSFISQEPIVDAPEPRAKRAGTNNPPQDPESPPVVISVGPDSIVVGSTDPEALQALTNLIQSLTGGPTSAGGAEYKIFPLHAADATQIQQTLNELLGLNTFSSSSFFGGSSTPTTSLKIVADTRTNSLVVYGNVNELTRVAQLLQVLDRDAPTSAAVSSPRIIPVRYANASSVARVIRDVYAARLQGGSNQFGGTPGGFSPGSPFGGFGSSGSSSSRGSRSNIGSLSIGVDEQSNSIVVSCSEATFQEVKSLVESLDVAASDTQRTVQIVTIKNSTPSAVQDALNGLMGINTRSSSRTSSSDSSSRGFDGRFSPMGGSTMPFGGFPGGGPFVSPFFNRGGGDDRGGFDRSRFFDGGRSFDGGRFFDGFRGGERRP